MERRNRRHPRSSDKWFTPGPLHHAILNLLQDYNYLSSAHIIAHTGGYRNYVQRNLTKLVSEKNTPHKGPYLRRPQQQQFQPNYLNKPEVYELTERAYAWLKEHGRFDALAHRITHLGRRGPHSEYPHDVFADELLSSLALGIRDAGHRIVHVSRILAKAPPQVVASQSPLTFDLGDRRLTPDRVFGIKKSDSTYDFFALEADRGTMPVSRNGKGSSIARKIDAYRELMAGRAYERRLNVPNFRVLLVTVSEANAQSALEIIARSGGLAWLYVKSVPEFADPFKSVLPLPAIYSSPWQRAGFPDAFINQT